MIPYPQTWLNNRRWEADVHISGEIVDVQKRNKMKQQEAEKEKIKEAERRDVSRMRKKIEEKIQELEGTDPEVIEKIREEIDK